MYCILESIYIYLQAHPRIRTKRSVQKFDLFDFALILILYLIQEQGLRKEAEGKLSYQFKN
jgi:hypothetical protein